MPWHAIVLHFKFQTASCFAMYRLQDQFLSSRSRSYSLPSLSSYRGPPSQVPLRGFSSTGFESIQQVRLNELDHRPDSQISSLGNPSELDIGVCIHNSSVSNARSTLHLRPEISTRLQVGYIKPESILHEGGGSQLSVPIQSGHVSLDESVVVVGNSQNVSTECTSNMAIYSETIDNENNLGSPGNEITAHNSFEVSLASRFTRLPNLTISVYFAAAISVTSFSIYYAWNASLRLNPSQRFLFGDPDNTILAINLLSYLSTILVNSLTNLAFDQLRWTLCYSQGLTFLNFLSLSPATGIVGLVHLIFSPVPRPSRNIDSFRHRIWSLERLVLMLCLIDRRIILYAFHGVLGFILLLNIAFEPLFLQTEMRSQARGGVFPFNSSRTLEYSDTLLQAEVLSSFRATTGSALFQRPYLQFVGNYSIDACVRENTSCAQIYLIQSPPFVLEIQGFPLPGSGLTGFSPNWDWERSYLKAFQTPIYHIFLSYRLGRYNFESTECRDYGYPGQIFSICARDMLNSDGPSSVLIGITHSI